MSIGRRRTSRSSIAILAALASSCRAPAPSAAIDPVMSSRVPPSSIALAGVKLDRLRGSPLYPKLPDAVSALLQPFRDAHSLLVASTGAEFLIIARGSVPGATPGSNQRAPDLSLMGAPALIAAATAPHPPAAILAAAETVAAETRAADRVIWIAVRGGVPLPLEGNLANLNNLVKLAEYLTLSAGLSDAADQRVDRRVDQRVDQRVDMDLIARCPSPDAALQFEQRLRALLSLTAAANARQPAIAAMLHSVQLRRERQTVHATLSAPPDALAKLLP